MKLLQMARFGVSAFCLFCACLLIAAPPSYAAQSAVPNETEGETAAERAEDAIQGILDSYTAAWGADWRETVLCEQAERFQWVAIALRQYEGGLTAYGEALGNLDQSAQNGITRLKTALTRSLFDSPQADITLPPEAAGDTDVMTQVFRLILEYSRPSEQGGGTLSADTLLRLQNADGGFSLTGGVSDPDITAMVLQALAVSENGDTDAAASALAYLSAAQLPNGGFMGWMSGANCESTAQVLCALAALDIRLTDERFVKNGFTVLDALLAYRLDSGAFAHTSEGGANDKATEQALCALVAYLRQCVGLPSLYTAGDAYRKQAEAMPPEGEVIPEETAAGEESAPYGSPAPDQSNEPDARQAAGEIPSDTTGSPAYKPVLSLILLSCAVPAAVYMRKRAAKSALLWLALCLVAALCLVWFLDIRTPAEYYGSVETAEGQGRITISIYCERALGLGNHDLPSDGVWLPPAAYALMPDDTVYSVLSRAAKDLRLLVDTEGTGMNLYVKGIGGLYERDGGALSGWVYTLNGEMQSAGAGNTAVKDGDVIVWQYSLELGNDVE